MIRVRQQKIVDYVHAKGITSLAELAQLFNVSEFTIRRDIDYLAGSHLLEKIKGGAKRIETPSQFREAALTSRMRIKVREKEIIAERALAYIEPGDTLFLDGSSTIITLARALANAPREVTVVTNSTLIALELAESPKITLVSLGGIFDHDTYSFVFPENDQSTNPAYYPNKAFLSCAGFIPEEGTFENAARNSPVKRQIAAAAQHVYLLIDSEKFNRRALTRVLNTDQIDAIITDMMPGRTVERVLQAAGISLTTADESAS
jgi:DeoR/GlpR family transcriptional regulator of sugar metabolism